MINNTFSVMAIPAHDWNHSSSDDAVSDFSISVRTDSANDSDADDDDPMMPSQSSSLFSPISGVDEVRINNIMKIRPHTCQWFFRPWPGDQWRGV